MAAVSAGVAVHPTAPLTYSVVVVPVLETATCVHAPRGSATADATPHSETTVPATVTDTVPAENRVPSPVA